MKFERAKQGKALQFYKKENKNAKSQNFTNLTNTNFIYTCTLCIYAKCEMQKQDAYNMQAQSDS